MPDNPYLRNKLGTPAKKIKKINADVEVDPQPKLVNANVEVDRKYPVKYNADVDC